MFDSFVTEIYVIGFAFSTTVWYDRKNYFQIRVLYFNGWIKQDLGSLKQHVS